MLLCSIVVVIAGGALAWMLLGGILLGHFHGILAEKVERTLGIAEDEIKPAMTRHPQFADAGKRFVCEVAEFADAVLLDRAPGLVRRIRVSEQAGEDLVDDGFALHGVWLRLRGFGGVVFG